MGKKNKGSYQEKNGHPELKEIREFLETLKAPEVQEEGEEDYIIAAPLLRQFALRSFNETLLGLQTDYNKTAVQIDGAKHFKLGDTKPLLEKAASIGSQMKRYKMLRAQLIKLEEVEQKEAEQKNKTQPEEAKVESPV